MDTVSRTATTNEKGFFRFSDMASGAYTLEFKDTDGSDNGGSFAAKTCEITVSGADVAMDDIQLDPADAAE